MGKSRNKSYPSVSSLYRLPIILVWLMLLGSLAPLAILLTGATPALQASRSQFLGNVPLLGHHFKSLEQWYASHVPPVQELRPLTPFPDSWEGSWPEADKNYFRLERWFGDNLGLRDLMIRTKNELDYQLFRSSSRVYFGKDDYIYGRPLTDRELPATEEVLKDPSSITAVHQGITELAESLSKRGMTPIFIFPMQKQYLTPDNLPFFAPRLPQNSHFMQLYQSLKDDSTLHFVDVFEILKKLRETHQIFYKQDFHWTHASAMAVSEVTVNLIAELEGSSHQWQDAIEVEPKPFVGSETRFSARLNAQEQIMEPELVKSWSGQGFKPLDAKTTGLEFETNPTAPEGLLPPTCLYGNSFSDGMNFAGLPDHFQKLTKLDRQQPLSKIPELTEGRCKYVIIQVLDIQSAHWLSLKK